MYLSVYVGVNPLYVCVYLYGNHLCMYVCICLCMYSRHLCICVFGWVYLCGCVCTQFPKSLNMSNCRREHKGLAHKKPLFIENDILRFEPLMSHACLVYLLEGANIDDFFFVNCHPTFNSNVVKDLKGKLVDNLIKG